MITPPAARRSVLGGALVGAALTAVLAGSLAAVPPARAQDPVPAKVSTSRAPVGPNGRARAAAAAEELILDKPAAVLAGRDDALHAGSVITSEGLAYVPYTRSYRSLPVVGGDFVVATDGAGRVLDVTVAQTSRVALDSVTPAITRDRARATSATQVDGATLEGTRLVVLQRATSRLAWETTVRGTRKGEPSRLTVYLDAATGAVLRTTEHVLRGTGDGNWEGTGLSLPTTPSGSTYLMQNAQAPTLTCENAATATTFSDPDDLWGTGVGADRETGCVDAFYATEQQRQMLSAWLGRDGMDGSGGWVPTRVGLNDVNAYYDGTQVAIGKNTARQWIGATDVTAHEYGHGIDDTTPGGISGGGTQEFVADAFGAATEWYADNPADPRDFTVGEEVDLTGDGPIRSMSDPSELGDPSCWSASIPNAEVHAAAGPGNHWYYLLAIGSAGGAGQPASPTCNGTTTTGIGVQAAQTILYHAMLRKTSRSSYPTYRTWTLQAAKDLYPSSCATFAAVKAAWDAVRVPAQVADPTCTRTGALTVDDPGPQTAAVKTAITPFTLTASGGKAPYAFKATGLPKGLRISGTGTVSGTPKAAGTFSVTVTALDRSRLKLTGAVSFTFTVTGPSGACASPGQKLGNPGFEDSTDAPWDAVEGVIVDVADGGAAHAGSRFAWLGGYGTAHVDELSQTFTAPAGCSATLSFWISIATDEVGTTPYDVLTVSVGESAVATYSNADATSDYVLRTVPLAGPATGSPVTLTFTGTEDATVATSFLVDDVAVTVG